MIGVKEIPERARERGTCALYKVAQRDGDRASSTRLESRYNTYGGDQDRQNLVMPSYRQRQISHLSIGTETAPSSDLFGLFSAQANILDLGRVEGEKLLAAAALLRPSMGQAYPRALLA